MSKTDLKMLIFLPVNVLWEAQKCSFVIINQKLNIYLSLICKDSLHNSFYEPVSCLSLHTVLLKTLNEGWALWFSGSSCRLSHWHLMWVLVRVLAALLLMQFPAVVPGEVEGDGPGASAPVLHRGPSEAPVFSVPQPLQLLGE